jgi:hypothetical protein
MISLTHLRMYNEQWRVRERRGGHNGLIGREYNETLNLSG